MSVTLRIENMATLPDGGPLSYTLTGQRGADIGRDPHLDWTLPDPSRHVSGTHCEIRFQDGDYVLRDVSANGTFLNGSDHRVQSPYRLKSGDRLTIGDYIVVVEIAGETTPDPVSHPGPQPAFQDLWGVETLAPPMDPRELRPPSDARPIQPDFLEWAVDVPLSPGVGFVARPSNPQPAVPAPVEAREVHAEAAPVVPKPRRSIWVSPAPSGPWGDGAAAAPTPARELATPSVPEPDAELAESDAVQREASRPVETGPSEASTPAVARTLPVKPSPRAALADASAATASGHAPAPDLLGRFLKGADVPVQAVAGQDAGAMMERLGRVLLQVTGNVKQLLEARSQSKRLAGSSSHTMIASLDNNPLKFSASPAEALRTMLGERSGSYLDAEQTFRQSFDDLKNHQVKVLSAMQMALERLVEDLDPKAIQDSLGGAKGPVSWLGLQRAQLWTVYEQRWRSKKSRHGGGLRELFMEYFAECYDQGTPGAQK